MQLPRIRSYGQYRSANYGAHALQVDIGPLTLWFSYRTVVAFQVDGQRRVVHRNDWGPTTGKHLKWIDHGSKGERVPDEEFQALWNDHVEPLLSGAVNRQLAKGE